MPLVRTGYFSCLIAALSVTLFPAQSAAQALNLIADRFFTASQSDATVNLTLEGDFNGDGKPDLITYTTVQHGATLSILLGNGDGTMGAPLTISSGGQLVQGIATMSAGDFNGDGKLDFVVLYYNNSISVFLGKGDGTFQTEINTTIPNPPQLGNSLAVGDFNHDGRIDVALPASAPQQGAGTVLVLISNGDGTFATPVSYPINSYGGVVVGDFNGDGKSDLVAIGTNIYLLLGNGDGTFQSPRGVTRGCGQPAAALVADFNHDGFDDLALDSAILLSNGDGTFQAPICNSIYFPNVVADFNGDGIPDLLTVGSNVYLGKGDGTFQEPLFFQASLDPNGVFGGAGYAALSIADFNGDGKIDVAGPALGNNVAVVLGNGDGTFIGFAIASYGQASDFQAFTLNTGDLRNNGRNDLVMFGQTEGDQFGEVVSLLGNGNGTFQTPMVSGSASMTFGGVLADLNGDGLPDAVALDYNQTIAALLGNGKGAFIGSIYTPSSQPFVVGVGDFNGDTIPDIVVPGQVFLGAGDGTFGFPVTINAGAAPMVIGDVNGDGKTDIVQAGAGNAIEACLNNGNLSFTCISTSLAAVPAAIALADLDHDGKLDVVAGIGSQVQVLLGNGDGTFHSKGPFDVPSGTSSIAVADINGDGILDLAFGGLGVSVLLGNGDGTFQPAVTYDGRANVVAADFNGDGKIDLATFYGSYDIALLFNTVGLTPIAVVTPLALTFPSQAVNTTSPAQKVTLQNTGGASLSISQIAVSGANSADFNQTNTCGSGLAANASCSISVTFKPAAAGTRTGTLTISDSAGNQTVKLTGIGASLGLGVASGGSDSATVSAGSTAMYTLSIGGGGVSGTATLSCTGAPPGATCFIPGSVNVSDTQASNFMVNVSTTARSNTSLQRRALTFPWFWATAMIGLVWLPGERRTSHVARRIAGIASLLLLILSASCGGGGGGGGSGSAGTPAGTYKLTVAATIGTTRQTQVLKLTVQ